MQAMKQQLQAAEATTTNQVVEFMCVMSEERQKLKVDGRLERSDFVTAFGLTKAVAVCAPVRASKSTWSDCMRCACSSCSS